MVCVWQVEKNNMAETYCQSTTKGFVVSTEGTFWRVIQRNFQPQTVTARNCPQNKTNNSPKENIAPNPLILLVEMTSTVTQNTPIHSLTFIVSTSLCGSLKYCLWINLSVKQHMHKGNINRVPLVRCGWIDEQTIFIPAILLCTLITRCLPLMVYLIESIYCSNIIFMETQ